MAEMDKNLDSHRDIWENEMKGRHETRIRERSRVRCVRREKSHLPLSVGKMAADIEQFSPLFIQAAMFIRGMGFSDPLSIAQGIQHAVGGIFDGQPGVFPVPPNAPANVPRIVLKDGLQRYQCKVSAGRLDLAFDGSKKRASSTGAVWDEYSEITRQLAEYLKKKNPTRVWRLGLVVRLFKVLEGSANIHIREKYLRDDRFEDPYEMHLSVLNKENMGGFGINRWLRLRPMRKRDDPTNDSGLVVEIDINTHAEENNDFTEEEITRFFEEAYQHIALEDMRLVDSE
ncbi:hypothetical protein HQ563_12970 [bacterium]|nr:hypothetical protein [bacterium]